MTRYSSPAFQLQAGDVIVLEHRPGWPLPPERREHVVRSVTFHGPDRLLLETATGATFQLYDDDSIELAGPDPIERGEAEAEAETCSCDMRHPDDDSPFEHHPLCANR